MISNQTEVQYQMAMQLDRGGTILIKDLDKEVKKKSLSYLQMIQKWTRSLTFQKKDKSDTVQSIAVS